jgi:glycoside/pentoside/hexuronide:cation symporter, GPH family
MWWFFTNPRIASPGLLVAWAAASFIVLSVTYSVVNIPYSSLTPELTSDYNERSSLNAFRFMCAIVGTILGAVAVDPLIGLFGGRQGKDKSLGLSMVGLIFGVVMLLTAAATVVSVREPSRAKEPKAEKGFVRTYLSVFRNGPFLITLGGYALNLIGLTFLQNVITYYFPYIYSDESKKTLAMGLLLVIAMIFIPISVPVSKRLGKKRTWQICFFVLGTACLAI